MGKKRILILIVTFIVGNFIHAQSALFEDNFDNLQTGIDIVSQNANWSSWYSNNANSSALISSAHFQSPNNSLHINGQNSDVVIPIGPFTNGQFKLSFDMLIPTGSSGGYFNGLHQWSNNQTQYEWAFDIFFNGTGNVSYVLGGTNVTSDLQYPLNQWFTIDIFIDLDNDEILAKLNNGTLFQDLWSINNANGNQGLNQLSGFNFFGTDMTNGSGSYFIDNVHVLSIQGFGCTNPQACNFNPNVTSDDGSCLFTGNPCNDNNTNTFDDIIIDPCVCTGTEFLSGCMNQTACNYNPSANIDNGDCRFVGDLCNDNIYATIQDAIDQNCICAGTPTDLNGNNENTYQGLFYQAVARNADGTPMANQVISIRFSLHQSTAAGAIEYQEVQNVNSNALGLFTTYFGSGQASVGNFNNIQWGVNAKYLQVEMYTTNWQTLGTQQLAAVPFAIRAKQVDAEGLKLQSPNGTCYILQVNNAGQLSTIAVPCD